MSILSYEESCIEDSTIDLGEMGQFVIVGTNAPVEYDYGYTINLWEYNGERLVLVDASRLDYQLGRYGSGLNHSKVLGGHYHVQAQVTKMLQNRLYGNSQVSK
jgi:hypothetical protein